MSDNTEAFEKLTKAKARLVQRHPFFAAILLSLPLIEVPDLPGRTMSTDMRNIYYHPDFVNYCSINEIMGVLCHETLHVAYLHGLRKGNKIHKIWNMACDYAINPVLLDAGLSLPMIKTEKGEFVPPLYEDKYRNWSAPEIYDDLMKNVTVINISFGGDGEPGDTPMWGEVTEPQKTGENDQPTGEGISESEQRELENEIKIKVKGAAESAKAIGKLPGGVEGLIEAIGKPKIDWKAYIQQWVSGIKPDDYSWVRPNRSMLVNHGVYMPRLQFNGSGVGILSIDTSGSVSDNELVSYITEIVGVIEICNPDKLYIIQHDSVITRIDVWEAGMDFKNLKIAGRGGTCIMPTFKQIDKLEEKADWMIVFSDMEIGDWPKDKRTWPDYPILLASTGGKDTAPEGLGTYIPLRDAI